MDRRNFIKSALFTSSAVALAGGPGRVFAAQTGDARLAAELDRQFQQGLLLSPMSATGLGLDKGRLVALKGQLDDYSEAGRQATVAAARSGIMALRSIAPASLTPALRRQREIALYRVEEQAASARFGIPSVQQCYPISQQNGAYFEVPDLMTNQHTIETAADAEAYLARLDGFARALDQQTAVQRAQAARHLVAPAWALDLALGQMKQLREAAPETSLLVRSLVDRAAAKGIAGDWQRRAAEVLIRKVHPALDRQMALLGQLKRTTRPGDGAWRLPDGEAIYGLALQQATTTTLSPEEVHRTGLDQVAELSGRLDAILREAGYTTGSVGERLAALNKAPEQRYPNTDEGRTALIGALNAGLGKMAALLPRAFDEIPREQLEVRRVPPEIQDGAPNGYYFPAAVDGSRPAIYWINLKDTGDWPRYQQPSLTYHEGVPGHHLQGGYARLGGDLPPLLQNYFISAYGEGWALYAEQLADELGGYDGIERAGYLQSFLFRAARLVVDTGLHHKRWTREQATRYLVETTGFTPGRSQREVERYCTMIGQACSYKVGHNKWLELRERARTRLGTKFSLGWFHAVLKEGSMPLALLERRVDERIAERLAAG